MRGRRTKGREKGSLARARSERKARSSTMQGGGVVAYMYIVNFFLIFVIIFFVDFQRVMAVIASLHPQVNRYRRIVII